MRAYVVIRDLEMTLQPCHVVRRPTHVLIAFHSGASRVAIVEWLVMNLTEEEQALVREGYGCGPINTPLPDWMLEPLPLVGYVPKALRCPGDPGIQGVNLDPDYRPDYEQWAIDLIERDLRSDPVTT